MEASKKFKTVDEYLSAFSGHNKKILEELRKLIKKTVPESEEVISYNMPAFKLYGKGLIYFAGYKSHIGLYPVPKGDATFQEEIIPYRTGKGTLQFPLDKSLPVKLITKVIEYRMTETKKKAEKK